MTRPVRGRGTDALELAVRRYRRLLVVLPAAFRRGAEAEMTAMFRAGYRRRHDAAWPVRAAFWLRMTADVFASALAERSRRRPALTARPAAARRRDRGMFDPAPCRRRLAARVWPHATNVRQSVRRLLRAPGRTLMTASTLGIGIGGAIVMLTVVRGVLLQPLPFARPDRLVRVLEVDDSGRTWWPSFANFADWREHGGPFAGIAAVDSPRVLPVIHAGRAARVAVGRLTPGLFSVLGVPLARGRGLADGEHDAALVSASFWRDELGGRPLQNLSITVGPRQLRVVGVTPPGFHFLGSAGTWSSADVWLPLDRDSAAPGRRTHGYHVVGRLAEQVDPAAARDRMDALAQTLAANHGEPTHAHTLYLTPLQEVVVGEARQPLTVLSYAALLVLVVAACNLAGALFAVGLSRRAELGVRRALGATRADLGRHLLAESLLLAVPGALFGLATAWCGVRLLRAAAPAALARLGSVSLDWPAVATAFAVSLAATLLGGLVPAVVLSGAEPGRAVGGGGRTTVGRRESFAWHSFVAAQVTVAVALLAIGGPRGPTLRRTGCSPGCVRLTTATSMPSPSGGWYARSSPAGWSSINRSRRCCTTVLARWDGRYRPAWPARRSR